MTTDEGREADTHRRTPAWLSMLVGVLAVALPAAALVAPWGSAAASWGAAASHGTGPASAPGATHHGTIAPRTVNFASQAAAHPPTPKNGASHLIHPPVRRGSRNTARPALDSGPAVEATTASLSSTGTPQARLASESVGASQDAATTPLTAPSTAASPSATSSFDAIDDDGTVTPPDPNGAVGPNHVMTALNNAFRVQSKQGADLQDVVPNCFWNPSLNTCAAADPTAAGICPAITGNGPAGTAPPAAAPNPFSTTGPPILQDPRLRYDASTGHWILVESCDPVDPNYTLMLAVSQTTDPTGSWWIYTLPFSALYPDGNPPTGTTISGDSPSVGFDSSRIAVTVNNVDNVSGGLDSGCSHPDPNVANPCFTWIAFSKAAAESGGSLTSYTQGSAEGFSETPAVTYGTTSTMYLLDDWDGTQSLIRLSTITGPVGGETLQTGPFITVPEPAWADKPTTVAHLPYGDVGTGGFAPQLGSPTLIDTGDSRIGGLVYRNGSLWAAHTVFVPAGPSSPPSLPTPTATPSPPAATPVVPTRSSVQWMQLTPSGCDAGSTTPCSTAVNQAGRIDDPNNVQYFAYPSIAANRGNDVLLGYNRFSAQQYASYDYSYCPSCATSRVMETDTVLKPGQGPYYRPSALNGDDGPSANANRWGDYSTTVVDPDDVSMWTIGEYAAQPGGTSVNSQPLPSPLPSAAPDPALAGGRWGTWWGGLVSGLPYWGEASTVLVQNLRYAGGTAPLNGGLGICDTGLVQATTTGYGLCSGLPGPVNLTVPGTGTATVPPLTISVSGPTDTVTTPNGATTGAVTAHSVAAHVTVGTVPSGLPSSGAGPTLVPGAPILDSTTVEALSSVTCGSAAGSAYSRYEKLKLFGSATAYVPPGSIANNPNTPINILPGSGVNGVPWVAAVVTLNYQTYDPVTHRQISSAVKIDFPTNGSLAGVLSGTIYLGYTQAQC